MLNFVFEVRTRQKCRRVKFRVYSWVSLFLLLSPSCYMFNEDVVRSSDGWRFRLNDKCAVPDGCTEPFFTILPDDTGGTDQLYDAMLAYKR